MQIKTKLLLYFFAFLISLGCFQSAHASTFVWHGGTSGDWGTGANWLVGGVEQAAAPTGRDDVTFDNSAHTYTITGAADAVCISINTLGTTNAVSINIGVYNLTAYGSATLKSGDSITCEMFRVAYTASGTFTQSGATVSAHLYLSPGTSHTITLGSDVSLSGTKYFYFVSGILDTSANSYDITCYRFDDSGTTAARTLTLNSSIITCQLFVISGTAANLTVTSTDHTITINSDSATANNFAGKAWGIVNFKSNASEARAHAITFGTGASFVQFNIDQLTDRRDCSLSFSGDFYVSDSSTWKSAGAGNDDPTVRLLIRSDVIGTERNVDFTQADQTLTITDVDLQDIKIHDTNYPTVALTRVGDCGGNAKTNDGRHRQNVSDAKTVYMYGAAVSNSNYYDNIWSSVNTDQAARIAALALTNFPLPQDTAVIDDLTWTATGKYLTTNYPRLGTIDASALTTASCQINVGSSTDSTYYGSLNIPSGKANGQGSTLTFDARLANLSIDVGGSIGSSSPVTINSYGNVVSLGSAITHTGTFTLTRGTFDLNGKTFTTNSFSSSNTNTRTLDNTGGAGKIVVNGTSGTVFDMTDPTNLTVNNAPKIDIGDSDNTLTGDITFAGGGKTFGDFTNKKHAGNFDTLITGSNIFGSFTLETPDVTYQYSDIQFTAGTTTTVSSFVADGTASYPINITSVGGAATHTLLDASGNNTVTYCNISYSSVDGGGGWYAMTTSGNTNGGNNAGWIFTITEFVSIVDPGASAESDYSSLSTWNTGVATDLTAASTMVFAGTKTGTINDNASVTGATSGATATVVHANKAGTQLLLENISGGPFQNGEQIRVDVSNFFTTSNTGDSAIAVAKCRTSTGQADTTAVTITGWTTSAENYIKIWTDPSENYRHKGVWDENKYSLKTNNIQTTLKLSEEYVRVDGLQIKYTGTYSGYMNAIESAVDTTSSDQQISNNIINVAANNTGGSIAGIDMSSSSNNCARKIWNNIIYLTGSTSATPYGMWINAYAVDYTYNNTIIGFTYGFYIYGESNTNILLKNNIAQNCTTWGYSGYFNSSSTNNITNISAIDGVFGASADSGTTDSTTANKLVDSDQDFSMTVKVGMIIKNTTDSTYTYVTAVDSNSTLSVANDIMPTGKAYTIYTNMYGSPTFEDSANYDFHLDSSDTVAKNKGANLYADTYIPVTTDIDGNARPNSSTTFDIGADENVARIYRSVGPSATTALTTGISNYHSNHLTISGVTATFEYPLDDNIGVGDAIQYDADGDGDIDASDGIAFIDKRFSSVSYRIKKSDGTAPTAMAVPDIDWSLFRAYTSLSLAEAGTENVGIDADLVNFDTGDVNLTTNNLQWNISCYANGTTADTAQIDVAGWTTAADNYIKIYTPTSNSEVGTSQRHNGAWATSKYYMEVSDATAIRSDSIKYFWVDGLQVSVISPTANNRNVISRAYNVDPGNELKISNCLLKGHNSGTYSQQAIFDGDADSVMKVWNNIIYNLNNTLSTGNQIGIGTAGLKAYIFNNTVIGSYMGIDAGHADNILAKNNISKGANSAAFDGTFAAGSGYNATDRASMGYTVTDGAVGDRPSQTFSFVDEASFNFHLLPSDAGAKNFGADLSNDPYLPFNSDADDVDLSPALSLRRGGMSDVSNQSNFSRPRGTTWDIGADEVITPIYRSVAPEADGDLGAIDDDNSLADTLSITTAGVATFEVAVADNVGVGDAIVFDDDADNDLDANDTILFIHGRTDSTHYTVRTDTGGFPTASTTDNDKWSIYRAYTSLSLAEAGTKNTAIPISFTGGNRDIKANSEQWNIACYANGTTADTTAVAIDGWTTSSTNYIRVYTPYLTSEVGASQRHSGKWDTSKYRLEVTNDNALYTYHVDVRIDGLQMTVVSPSGIRAVLYFGSSNIDNNLMASNCLIKGHNSASYYENLIQMGSGRFKIWNNILYDLNTADSNYGIIQSGSGSNAYVYNNTFVGGDANIVTVNGIITAKNNILKGANYAGFSASSGIFSGDSNNNATDKSSISYIPGANNRVSQTFTFADATNKDYHLASTDAGAKDYGADLSQDYVWQMMNSSDSSLRQLADQNDSRGTDIDGAGRPMAGSGMSWDIGADEVATAIYRSVGPSKTTALANGATNHLNISGSTATFDTAPGDTIGVGDVLEYDANGDGSGVIDSVAFITGRTSDTVYTIKSAIGAAPIPQTTADEIHWNIFRAYSALTYAEKGDENTGLTDAVENFDDWTVGGVKDADDVGKNLLTYNEQWNIAAYANGTTADGGVSISDWTTGASNYLKIYTPTATTEVGTSQRHQGKLDTSKYWLNVNHPGGSATIGIGVNYVRIEGLQTSGYSTSGWGGVEIIFSIPTGITDSDIMISNNILKTDYTMVSDPYDGGLMSDSGWSNNGGVKKIYNNIMYGIKDSHFNLGINSYGGTWYVYNNTIVNPSTAITQSGGTIIAKNNIIQNASDGFNGYSAGSDYNISNIASDAPSASYRNGLATTVTFEDAANFDFHLVSSDTMARNVGADLSADTYLPITTDIDGHTRSTSSHTGAFDIGADEGATAMYFSVGQTTSDLKTGSPTVSVTTGVATLAGDSQAGINMGVGDAIVAGGNTYYITGKTSTTVWTVRTATGTVPADLGSTSVTSISHAFASLEGAVDAGQTNNAGDATHLNTKDLFASNYQLNIPCYYDTGADQTAVTVQSWTTGVPNYLKIYTPTDTNTEANSRQRHWGKLDTGKFYLTHDFNVLTPNVYFDGLQIKCDDDVNYGFDVQTDGTTRISNLILKHNGGASSYNYGIRIEGSANVVDIWNSVIYNISTSNDTSNRGISAQGITNVYNTTVIGGYYGIVRSANTLNCKNVYAGGSTHGDIDDPTILTTSASLDTSGTAGLQNVAIDTTNFTNVTSGSEDYHLPSASALRNTGTNLSADTNFAFATDIDGNGRGQWDIGADEGSNEMVATVKQAGGDYSSLSGWQTGMVTNLVTNTTMVYGGTETSTISDNASLYLCRSGTYQNVTATNVHTTTTQSLIESISAPTSVISGDKWYTNSTCDSANYFTMSDAGNPAIAVAKIDGAWASADTTAVTITGWETGPTNYVRVYTASTARHSGKWDDTKYRLEVTNDNINAIIVNQVGYVKIDGLQVRLTAAANGYHGIYTLNPSGVNCWYEVSNNIVKGTLSGSASSGGILADAYSGHKAKIWNNIVYNFVNGSGGDGIRIWNTTGYVYNNTVYNTAKGFLFTGGTFIAKNNIAQNCKDGFVGAYGFSAGSDYNLTDNTSGAPGSHSKQNKKVKFMDENGDDFRLSPEDTNARDAGTDLSADIYLAFSTDIKSKTRSGTWDIGADETSTAIYRSIAPDDNGDNNLAALAVGAANSMTISGSTATFTSDLPTNVGVGDVLQYDSNNNGSIGAGDVSAFVYARIDSKNYTVKTASGAAPTARAGDTYWSIFRAYTSLSYAETGTENTAIDSNLRDFDTWSGGKDIVTSGEQWNISCYANGTTADSTAVAVDGWITSASDYIKIYTPTAINEVGISQRHSGKWDDTKYKLRATNVIPLDIRESFVRIDGLQLSLLRTSGSNGMAGIHIEPAAEAVEIRVSNNIIKGELSGGTDYSYGIQCEYGLYTGNIYIWDNIIYDFNFYSGGGMIFRGNAAKYVYNNTIYNSISFGIHRYDQSTDVYVKNNIVDGVGTTAFQGMTESNCSYNATNKSDLGYTAQTGDRVSQDFTYFDETNKDFHLANNDAAARNYGTPLSSDSNLSFSDDIDGELRNVGGAWDIGADESGTTVKINGGVKIEGGVKIQKN